ncbi:hypothetical protein IGI00_01045 [Bacillus thuringiensis]|nr:hypothetical protein [Bacillus thuringiensis]QPA55017.1 hypothetical protein INQ53_02960 [Lysinibacillus sphaericus]
MSNTQNVNLVLDKLQQLPVLPQGCLLHSDQGSVYTKGIIMSMSRKGTPADNAHLNRFMRHSKQKRFI